MSQKELEQVIYKSQKLETNLAGLMRTMEQVQARMNVKGGQMNINGSNDVIDKKTFRNRLEKIREAALEDDKTLRTQQITIEQQQNLLNLLKKELLRIRKEVSELKLSDNTKNNDEFDLLNKKYNELRKTMKERLILLRDELNDTNANVEAAFISKKEANNVCVTYWNGRGLTEPLRLMLAAINIKFQQKFLNEAKDLDDLRAQKKLYYDQVPLIEIDGLNLTQSGAAMRYLARRGGMYGDSDQERYVIDLIFEGSKDARIPFARYMRHCTTSEECKSTFQEERFFGAWERQLESNKKQNGLFVARESMADVAVFEVLDFYKEIFGKDTFNGCMKKYPHLGKLYELVYKFGRIETYIEKERNHMPREPYKACVDATLIR